MRGVEARRRPGRRRPAGGTVALSSAAGAAVSRSPAVTPNGTPAVAGHMTDHLRRAREEIQAAADAADGEMQEQLRSIDEGLMELTEGDKVEDDDPPRLDHLAELEEKLDGVADEKATEPDVRDGVERARDSIRAYRDERTE